MKNIVLIPVRLASTRLPGKALLKISGKPCLQILIERIQTVENLDDIMVCTTENKTDDPLIEFLQGIKIKSFRGNEKDILIRLKNAVEFLDVDNIIIIDGDDIFCEPDFIRKTILELEKNDSDCIKWFNLPFGTTPFGVKKNVLEKICKIKKTDDTETGWIRFFTDLDLFRVKKITSDNMELQKPEIRLSLDYEEDFQLFKDLVYTLPAKFTLNDILDLFLSENEHFKVNSNLKQKYWDNFKKNSGKLTI